MRIIAALLVAAGCSGDSIVASATETTSDSDGATTTTTSSTVTTQSGLGPCSDDYGPCPANSQHERCIHSEGASICGAACAEYGPGWAPGRCQESPLVIQTICPWTDEVPGACLILCNEPADCPEPGMVCVPCPEPFRAACEAFSGWTETGPNLCAWPDP